MSKYISFYDDRRHETYAHNYDNINPESRISYPILKSFIIKYELFDKKCLEIGSSGGFFQDMVENYFGVDVAYSLKKYYHKPYFTTQDSTYPFPDNMFDAIWTFDVYEHIPDLQKALLEIKRLLKSDGVVLFSPAWQCRSWAADGYAVRPFSDFNWKGKIIKILIPIRNNVVWRSIFVLPKRIFRHFSYILGYKFKFIRYKRLNPNYEIFWTSDSDACNSIDPHDAILWFLSNGFTCTSHPSFYKQLIIRTGPLTFKKK